LPTRSQAPVLKRRGLMLEPELALSISVTTRPPRPGEVNGRDYHFIGRERYQGMVDDGDLLEHAVVYGHGYGTPRGPVDAMLGAGRDVLFDIDWQGAQQLREVAGEDMTSLFILPPSAEELERRLRRRAQDTEEVLVKRLARVAADVTHFAEYDYVLINDDIDVSVGRAQAILAAERLRRRRQPGLVDFVSQFRS
jgi:guanylate kinase